MPKSEEYRGTESGDITTLLSLYPKKLNKSSFGKIRSEYKRQTGHDICDKIGIARKGTISEIDKMNPEKLPKDLRVSLFKLLDYSIFLGFCKRKQE